MTRGAVLAILAMAGCGDPVGPGAHWQLQLDRAKARWEANGLAAYEYTYRFSCGECLPEASHPRLVRIRDGAVVVIIDLETWQDVDPAGGAWSIPAQFARIQEYINGGARMLEVAYHPVHGAPVSVAVDPIPNAIDDEHGFTISELAGIPHP